jgi:hypothetical protein
MYEFATVVLLGLAVAKVVDLMDTFLSASRAAKIVLAFLLGAVLTWITDYSIFGSWGIQFRSLWMGTVATGLVIGGVAAVWHEILRVMSAYADRYLRRTPEPESRTPARVA